jgi:hypothetical protein
MVRHWYVLGLRILDTVSSDRLASFEKIKKMISFLENKIFGNVHVLCVLVFRKINENEF